MRNIIRGWLEVPEVRDMSKYVKVGDIKEAVEDAIYEALSPELPLGYQRLFWGRDRDKNISGTLQKHVRDLVRESAEIALTEGVNKIIEPEEFIDEVVARIKSKQLSA